MLVSVLGKLVDLGNTVIVVEHNLDVVKCADWVIDVGPEGGFGAGEIVAEGTPEDIVKSTKSYTGKYLEIELNRFKSYIRTIFALRAHKAKLRLMYQTK